MKVADLALSIWFSRYAKTASLDPDWLRITDNMSVMARFNDEKPVVEFILARIVPVPSRAKMISIIRDLHSAWLYKQLEAAVDGIIDFKLEEEGREAQNFMRIRTMRKVNFDSRWHRLRIADNFEVTLEK